MSHSEGDLRVHRAISDPLQPTAMGIVRFAVGPDWRPSDISRDFPFLSSSKGARKRYAMKGDMPELTRLL